MSIHLPSDPEPSPNKRIISLRYEEVPKIL